MGFRQGAYATLWRVGEKNGAVSVQLSTSYKKKDSTEYVVDWQGWATCKFDAETFAKSITKPIPENGIRVRIGNCEVKNKYDAEKKIMYTNYEVLGLEDASFNNNSNGMKSTGNYSAKPKSAAPQYAPDDNDVQLPF